MASKKRIIADKLKAIKSLQNELDVINRLELRRLYHFPDTNWYSPDIAGALRLAGSAGNPIMISESWGYIETFNKESVRVLVVASSTDHYQVSGGRHRGHIISYEYSNLHNFKPACREDLPLLIGLEFKSPELGHILSGKSKIKVD